MLSCVSSTGMTSASASDSALASPARVFSYADSMAARSSDGRQITGNTRMPVRNATSSTADRFVGSTIASVSAPAERPIGSTSCLRAMAAGTILRISAGIDSGNFTDGIR